MIVPLVLVLTLASAAAGAERPAPVELAAPASETAASEAPPTSMLRTYRPQPNGLRLNLLRDDRIHRRRVGVVADDWFYCYPPTGELILVPRGYATDFMSIPRWAKSFVDEIGDNLEAAVVHDWLYAVGEQPAGQRRRWADELFRRALMEQGVGVLRRNLLFAAVRRGGGDAYGREEEWNSRWGDPVEGTLRLPPPFARRTTGVVDRIDCERFDQLLPELRTRHRSADWPAPPR